MKRFLLFIAAFILLALHLQASMIIDSYRFEAGAAADPFVPSDISNMFFWYDKNDVWSGTEPVNTDNIGGTSEEWQDLSANGYDLAQSTAGAQPEYVTNQINSKPSIDFLTGDKLTTTTGSLNGESALSIVAVVKCDTVGTYGPVLVWNETGSWGSIRVRVNQDNISWRFGTGESDSDRTASGGAATFAYYYIIKDGLTEYAYKNGTLIGTETAANTDIANTGTTLTVGETGESTKELQVSEVIMYKLALTTANRTSLDGYMSSEYGL